MPDLDDEQQHWISRRTVLLTVVVGVLFAFFIAMDVLTPACFHDAWSGVFMMNMVIAQLTLICIWGTLVEGTFWIRLPWTILLLVISWSAICVGVMMDRGTVRTAEVLAMGLVWIYGFMISYIPLKLAAWLFGWRISQKAKQNPSTQTNRYAIRDMMLGTALLAIALGIGRQFLQGDWPTWATVLSTSRMDDGPTLIGLFLFSIISLVVKLPCIWIALAIPKGKIPLYSIVWIVCSGLLGLVELGILIALIGQPRGSEMHEFIFGLVVGHAAMAVVMIIALCALRPLGYRLNRQKRNAIEAV